MTKALILLTTLAMASATVVAQETKQCVTQEINNHKALICLHDPGLFRHWIFSLVVDGQLILNVVDDFAEDVQLTHTIPDGLTMELPLSKGKKGKISLVGGCLPESEKEIEIARICNFSWGNTKIVDNVRFVHELRYTSK